MKYPITMPIPAKIKNQVSCLKFSKYPTFVIRAVVAEEINIIKNNTKTGAATAGANHIKKLVLLLDSLPFFTELLLLNPKIKVINPEIPPTEVNNPPARSILKSSGPKMTAVEKTIQPIMNIKTHAPNRAIHSRSSSFVNRTENPTKSVAPNKQTNKYKGTPKQTHNFDVFKGSEKNLKPDDFKLPRLSITRYKREPPNTPQTIEVNSSAR